MAKVNAKLQWASRKGEKAIRAVLRDTQRRRDGLANVLSKHRSAFPTDTEIQAKTLISDLDRLLTYGARALSNLPNEQVARARALQTSLAAILRLGGAD